MPSAAGGSQTSWSVVATVREPALVLRGFVAHHLEVGAARVMLYFDDPGDPAIAGLPPHPRVDRVVCDAAYWRRVAGHRPDRIQARQDINATDALGRCAETWLAHIDADEFLIANQPIGTVLDQAPAERLVVHVDPCERVRPRWRPEAGRYDGFFKRSPGTDPWRRRWHRWVIRAAYGADRRQLRFGFVSHFHGKVLVRTGVPGLGHGSHAGVRDGVAVPPWRQDALQLLHFFAHDRQDWARKLAFKRPTRQADGSLRAMGTEAAARIGNLVDLDDPAVVDDLYRRFATASRWQYGVLRLCGLAFHHDLGMAAKIARVWGPEQA